LINCIKKYFSVEVCFLVKKEAWRQTIILKKWKIELKHCFKKQIQSFIKGIKAGKKKRSK